MSRNYTVALVIVDDIAKQLFLAFMCMHSCLLLCLRENVFYSYLVTILTSANLL